MKTKKLIKIISGFLFTVQTSLLISSCNSSINITNPPSNKDRQENGVNLNPIIPSNPDGNIDSDSSTPNQRLRDYVNRIDQSFFNVVDANSKKELDRVNTKPDAVVPDNFSLSLTNELAQGWDVRVNIVDRNNVNGTIDIKVSFSKQGENDINSNDIQFSGFKSLGTAIASKLLKRVKLKDGSNQEVTVVDVGNTNFNTLRVLNEPVILNKSNNTNVTIIGNVSSSDGYIPLSSTKLVQSGNTVYTNGFYGSFLNANASALNEIKQEFKIDDIYIDGQANLEKLYRVGNQDHGAIYYYLTSRPDKPLTIKSISQPDLAIKVPAIISQNIIPDDIDISISSVNLEGIHFDKNKQLYNQAYIDAINGVNNDAAISTYSYDPVRDRIKVQLENNKDYLIKAIKIPYIPPNNNDKIFFKVRYIFDGTKMNTDIFTAKIRAEKILSRKNIYRKVLTSDELAGTRANLSNYHESRRETVNNTSSWFWGWDIDINGSANSDNGRGVNALVNNPKTPASQYPNEMKNLELDESEPINSNYKETTNYLLLGRISYKLANGYYGYYWPNKLTILHIQSPDS
ncbi:hypothetical protein LNO75_00475 [Mycoplasma sp. T363T]|uniref:hypothetical protein n=1 Tax=Mycoplasma bradburyae TaxID=2963128 RepID=UPI002341AF53|nr:hypothetical protein [Mycoplasma bradburyae]MDC4163056.1 hypothetical protein [Mycoplasma bradburyae]